MNFDRRNFFFDLDGTLVDSSLCHERAWLDVLRNSAPALAKEFRYDFYKGMRTLDVLRALGVRDDEVAGTIARSKQMLYLGYVESGRVERCAHAGELIRELDRQGRRLFLVTGGSRTSTAAILRRFDWSRMFAAVVTGDDVAQSKPSPECYTKCLAAAGIGREDAIVIEDSLAGYQSACSAGLDVALVNNTDLITMPGYVGTLLEILHNVTVNRN